MSEKMKIMESLDQRAKCPECGKWNKCAVEEGKSSNTCWCISEPLLLKDYEENTCLCRSCLREKFSEAKT